MTEVVNSLKHQYWPCYLNFISCNKLAVYNLKPFLQVPKTAVFTSLNGSRKRRQTHSIAFNVSGFDSTCQFPWCTLRSQGLGSQKQGQSQLISHFCCFSALGPGSLPADNNIGHTCCINDWSALPPALTQLLYFNMILHRLCFEQKPNLIKAKV